ncbi:hypothetical protein AVEN_96562-1 [Araneus ventricosus]|uniref:Uncharacterized protein n=1 Tax=Araneus ventricosus TaxID=182803 RepID=A0A4Y2H8F7_ARAVE|nr:hypothetical protein AVEN_96562-1 [Araneus ventricosus]
MSRLCMNIGSSVQGKVLPKENQRPAHTRTTTERADPRIRHMVVAHCTAFSAEIRVSIGPRMTQRMITNRLLKGHSCRCIVALMQLTSNHLRLLRYQTTAH